MFNSNKLFSGRNLNKQLEQRLLVSVTLSNRLATPSNYC